MLAAGKRADGRWEYGEGSNWNHSEDSLGKTQRMRLGVIADNATRKHQSTGQLAAENALTLDVAGRRQDGRWKRSTVDIQDALNSGVGQWRNSLSQCGVVLDHLGREALVAVALGDRTLNEVHTEAERARDAERDRIERDAAAAKDEVEAKTFVEKEAPDLAARVDGQDQSASRPPAIPSPHPTSHSRR